jgi:hypothetical protein
MWFVPVPLLFLRLGPVRRLWIAQIVSVFGDFPAVFAMIAVLTFNCTVRRRRWRWCWYRSWRRWRSSGRWPASSWTGGI